MGAAKATPIFSCESGIPLFLVTRDASDLGSVLINLGRPVGLAMSALPSEADIRANLQQVCFGPTGDIAVFDVAESPISID